LALMAANLRKLRLRKTEKERTQKFYSYWIKFLGIFETCVTASSSLFTNFFLGNNECRFRISELVIFMVETIPVFFENIAIIAFGF
ncbi:hypothetical protein EKN08_06040, partial [Facklamia hominis]